MKDLDQWQKLMARLPPICRFLTVELANRFEFDPAARIAHALLQNGIDTYRAIGTLYAESLPTQAQVLVSLLIEVRMDLEIYLQDATEDPRGTVRRVADAMMLETVRQQRQSEFQGHELVDGAPSPETLLALEQELIRRYGPTTAKAMRRHGFSTLSVEERASRLGLSDRYNVVYRNFSRNVHGTDYAEQIRAQGLRVSSKVPDYEDLRNHVALSTAITCLWEMACLVNSHYQYGIDEQLKGALEMIAGFRHWMPVPETGDALTPSETAIQDGN